MPWPIVPAPITAIVSIVSEPLPGLLILWRTGLKRVCTPEATRFDYPNIRSYTIRSTEKAILSCFQRPMHFEIVSLESSPYAAVLEGKLKLERQTYPRIRRNGPQGNG